MDKEHLTHQSANDWVSCTCGKIFSDSRKGNISKWDKLERHKIFMSLKHSSYTGSGNKGVKND